VIGLKENIIIFIALIFNLSERTSLLKALYRCDVEVFSWRRTKDDKHRTLNLPMEGLKRNLDARKHLPMAG